MIELVQDVRSHELHCTPNLFRFLSCFTSTKSTTVLELLDECNILLVCDGSKTELLNCFFVKQAQDSLVSGYH